MFGGSTPAALASRFAAVAQNWVADGPAERAERARRKLMAAVGSQEPATLNDVAAAVGRGAPAVGSQEPATLNDVAAAVGRGAPAVSRSIDSLVRAGLVEREADPENRRRLALRLTARGRTELENQPRSGSGLTMRLERMAHSELRAIERALEILERAS